MSRYLSITTALAAVFLSAPLAAQATAQDSVVATAVTVAAAEPLVAPSDSVIRVSLFAPAPASRLLDVHAPTTPMARPAFGSEGGHNPAMMIVGGAAILVGAVVGGKSGTVIMVGGGILGLAGLWNYLK